MTAGEPIEHELAIDVPHRTRDRVGKCRLSRRHVVQRAMWLDMPELRPGRAGKALEGADLINDEIVNFLRRHLHRPAAETDEIGKPWMRADGHAQRHRGGDRRPHDRWIATVKSAGDVRRRHVRQHLAVGADFVCAEALPHVAIDVYALLVLSGGVTRFLRAPETCYSLV